MTKLFIIGQALGLFGCAERPAKCLSNENDSRGVFLMM
jgi:hypothetical protein